MRDALEQFFPQMEVIEELPSKRYRMTSGLDGLFQAPAAEELVALGTTAEAMRASGNHDRAAALASIETKVRASIRSSPAQTCPGHGGPAACGNGRGPGRPRPFEDEAVLAPFATLSKSCAG
jgi:hypothetical protein